MAMSRVFMLACAAAPVALSVYAPGGAVGRSSSDVTSVPVDKRGTFRWRVRSGVDASDAAGPHGASALESGGRAIPAQWAAGKATVAPRTEKEKVMASRAAAFLPAERQRQLEDGDVAATPRGPRRRATPRTEKAQAMASKAAGFLPGEREDQRELEARSAPRRDPAASRPPPRTRRTNAGATPWIGDTPWVAGRSLVDASDAAGNHGASALESAGGRAVPSHLAAGTALAPDRAVRAASPMREHVSEKEKAMATKAAEFLPGELEHQRDREASDSEADEWVEEEVSDEETAPSEAETDDEWEEEEVGDDGNEWYEEEVLEEPEAPKVSKEPPAAKAVEAKVGVPKAHIAGKVCAPLGKDAFGTPGCRGVTRPAAREVENEWKQFARGRTNAAADREHTLWEMLVKVEDMYMTDEKQFKYKSKPVQRTALEKIAYPLLSPQPGDYVRNVQTSKLPADVAGALTASLHSQWEGVRHYAVAAILGIMRKAPEAQRQRIADAVKKHLGSIPPKHIDFCVQKLQSCL